MNALTVELFEKHWHFFPFHTPQASVLWCGVLAGLSGLMVNTLQLATNIRSTLP
jgi:hypothetical protein